jgi:hypothetical protein
MREHWRPLRYTSVWFGAIGAAKQASIGVFKLLVC